VKIILQNTTEYGIKKPESYSTQGNHIKNSPVSMKQVKKKTGIRQGE